MGGRKWEHLLRGIVHYYIHTYYNSIHNGANMARGQHNFLS